MISVSDEWKNIIINCEEGVPESNVNIICDGNTVKTDSYSTSDVVAYCDGDLSWTKNQINRDDYRIASFEWNYFLLDGNYSVLQSTEKLKGFISDNLCDETGTFAEQPTIKATVGSNVQYLTLNFNNELGDVPFQIGLVTPKGFETKITNNYHIINFTEALLKSFNLSIQKWNMPYRHAKIKEFIPGLRLFWDKSEISNFKHERIISMVNEELPQCNLKFNVIDEEKEFIKAPEKYNIFVNELQNQMVVLYYGFKFENEDGSKRWTYITNDCFYVNKISKDNNSLEISIECVDNLYFKNETFTTDKKSSLEFTTYNNYVGRIADALGIKIALKGCDDIINNTQSNLSTSLFYNPDTVFWKYTHKEQLQLLASLMCGYLYRTPSGELEIRTIWDWNKTSQTGDVYTTKVSDYANMDNVLPLCACYGYHDTEETEIIRSISLSILGINSASSENIDTSLTDSTAGITIPPHRYRLSFSTGTGELEVENPLIYYGTTTSDFYKYRLHDSIMMWLHRFMSNKKLITANCLIDPRWQPGDIIDVEMNDGSLTSGFITEINIEYTGVPKGTVKILV